MFTHNYKGFYIHGYFDRSECRVVFELGETLGTFKSYRAAQLAISKFLSKAGMKTATQK